MYVCMYFLVVYYIILYNICVVVSHLHMEDGNCQNKKMALKILKA